MQKVRETSGRQQQLLSELVRQIAAIDAKYKKIFQELKKEREETLAMVLPPRMQPENNASGGIRSRSIRLEFLRFDGVDPARWIYRAEQFFFYHQTPLNQRISIASFHLEEKAVQ